MPFQKERGDRSLELTMPFPLAEPFAPLRGLLLGLLARPRVPERRRGDCVSHQMAVIVAPAKTAMLGILERTFHVCTGRGSVPSFALKPSTRRSGTGERTSTDVPPTSCSP